MPEDTNLSDCEVHHQLRQAVREICAGFPDAYWRGLDRNRIYPDDFVKSITDAGYLAALIPEEYGGAGLGVTEASIILEEVNRSGGNAGACHAQLYIMGTLLRHGSEEQKQRYLPGIASGDLRLQAFGVTEPNTGSDTTQLKTMAVRCDDSYVVNGQKIWTSRAEYSDLLLLLARTTPLDEVKSRRHGLSVFLVEMNKVDGLEIRPIRTMINHATTELFFSDMHIPASSLIGQEGEGFSYILDGMNAERILIGSESIGDARFFIDRATAYAKEREIFGRPIGQNQGVQFPIARSYASTEGAHLMVSKAAALFDSGISCGPEANMAKLLAGDAAWAAADMCMQTFGGFGFAEEYDIERKFRESRLYQIAPISTNMILAYIGQHVLGLPRSY